MLGVLHAELPRHLRVVLAHCEQLRGIAGDGAGVAGRQVAADRQHGAGVVHRHLQRGEAGRRRGGRAGLGLAASIATQPAVINRYFSSDYLFYVIWHLDI